MPTTICIDCLDIGGTELNAIRMLEALDQRGERVTVIHLHPDGPLLGRLRATGHDVVHLSFGPIGSRSFFGAVHRLRQLTQLRGTTTIHAQDIYSNVLCGTALLAPLRGMRRPRLIVSRRWSHEVPNRRLAIVNRWIQRAADVVTPNASALAPLLIAEGVRPERIVVTPNFLEDAAFSRFGANGRAVARGEARIPTDAIVIGAVARLVPVKRFDVALRAFTAARRELPSLHFVAVGEGVEGGALRQLAADLGIADAVTFTGTLPNRPLPHRLLDVALLCSDHEGFPNTIVEAGACAIPVIARDIPGVRDLITDGVSGLVVAGDDTATWAAAILELARDAGRRSEMGRALQEQVRENHGERDVINRLLALYRG